MVERCTNKKWEYDVFSEKISGAKEHRTELDKLMQGVRNRQYDGVMVFKLDRLGRSLKHLMQLVEEFNNKDVQFICLSPDLDTKTAQGRFFLQIMGAVAELEREFIVERTKAKLDYIKNVEKRKLGRPNGSKDKKDRRKSGYWLRYAKNTPPK
jgi:DNA invertase Pin-like site-specific DNA recombinase